MIDPAELPGDSLFPDLNLVTVPEADYNFETIAEAALWPLVNERWGGDFRREGEPNLPAFSISKAGFFEGEWYEVTLEASSESDEYYDAAARTQVKLLVHALDLYIDHLVPGQTQALIDMAVEEGSEPVKNYLEDRDEGEAESDDPHCLPEYGLRAVVGMRYLIDSDGDRSIVPYVTLTGYDRQLLWQKGLFIEIDDEDEDEGGEETSDSTEEKEAPPLPKPEFGSEDVRNLLIASTILKAPLHLTRYLDAVLRNPDSQ